MGAEEHKWTKTRRKQCARSRTGQGAAEVGDLNGKQVSRKCHRALTMVCSFILALFYFALFILFFES